MNNENDGCTLQRVVCLFIYILNSELNNHIKCNILRMNECIDFALVGCSCAACVAMCEKETSLTFGIIIM